MGIEPKRYASFTISFRSRHLKPRTNIFFLLNAGKAAAKKSSHNIDHIGKKIIFHIRIFTLSFIVVGLVQKRDQDLFARNHLNTIWRSLEVREITQSASIPDHRET